MSSEAKDRPQSILSHLQELRWRILKMALAVLAGAVIAFILANQIGIFLERPLDLAVPDHKPLVALTATAKFGVLMRIGFFGGVVFASPVVFYQIWAFVTPALTKRERKWAFPVVGAIVALFLGGVWFGYVLMPRGLNVLIADVLPDVESTLEIGAYYSFVIRFLLAFGITFQFPVFLFAIAAAGVIGSETLAKGRRWAVLVIVVVAAGVTPTGDPFTLLALSVPLYVLYEATYWLIRLVLRK